MIILLAFWLYLVYHLSMGRKKENGVSLSVRFPQNIYEKLVETSRKQFRPLAKQILFYVVEGLEREDTEGNCNNK